MSSFDRIRDVEHVDVLDLVERVEPTLVDAMRSPIVRSAATRALEDLDTHHDSGPWVAVCTETAEVVAASRSLDPVVVDEVRNELGSYARWECDRVPLAVVGLAEIRSASPDDAAYAAAEVVVRALSEIVLAEHRAAVATARAQQAEALAATDALTGLGNQRAWWERISEEDARIHRSETSAVVAVIDLDDLKTVNDQQGHLHGDLLLRVAAQTLRQAVRTCDHVARVGGDEFAVLAVDFDGPPSLLQERLTEALERADIRASVGVAVPAPGSSLLHAYAQADEAMYVEKRRRAGGSPTGTDG